jgi:hypothetical protein
VGSAGGFLKFSASLLEVRWLLDRVEPRVRNVACTSWAARPFWLVDFKRTEDPYDARRQLKWLAQRRVSGVAAIFSFFYAVPYIFGAVPNHLMSLSGGFAWA